ncbi:hypothetical protein C7B61_00915 [filamentous cyanobacterium CCP1]|nr:hypothetical protein C7B76_12580 [filamentous cyanobacterium CCP2]PSB68422.1 hypothetical protein C7B61_00915 [filamentous cyanobacterium CCP1]
MGYQSFSKKEIDDTQGTPGWLELYDLSLHQAMEARKPVGAYIEGIIGINGNFFPTSEILGKAIAKSEKISHTPGWVELKTLTFHSDVEAVAPNPPYIRGDMDKAAHFHPNEPFKIVFS